MYVEIQTSELADNNTGSCRKLGMYLEKENLHKQADKKEYFFSLHENKVAVEEVIRMIDQNGKGQLGKNDAKFYSVVIAPSQEELAVLESDSEKLKEYTRAVMQTYAENFNRDLQADDLVWFAKVEKERHYKDLLPEGKQKGEKKEGDNTHIHVIVSRKTADKKTKLSPMANERGTLLQTGKKQVVRGFDRDAFKEKCEKLFDKKFSYQRPYEQTYEFYKLKVLKEQREQIEKTKKKPIFATEEEDIILQKRNKEQKQSKEISKSPKI